MQTPRNIRLNRLALRQPLRHAASVVQGVLDGRQDDDLGPGVDRGPLVGKVALNGELVDFRGVDGVVDKVALVARLGVRNVCAEDDVVKGRSVGVLVGALERLADGLEEVDCFDAALLVEDHDSGAGPAGRVSISSKGLLLGRGKG